MKKHKTELRTVERKETYCLQPGCKFRGKRGAQGICYSASRWFRRVIDIEKLATEMVLDFGRAKKRLRKRGEYTRYLESSAVCSNINNIFCLDECISLRAENARLRLALKKWK